MKPGLRCCIKQMSKRMDQSSICQLPSSEFLTAQVGKLKEGVETDESGALPCIKTDKRRSPLPRQENNRKGPKRKETVYWIEITVISSNIPTLPPTDQPTQKIKSTLFSGIKTKGLSLPSKISVHRCSLMPNLFLKNKSKPQLPHSTIRNKWHYTTYYFSRAATTNYQKPRGLRQDQFFPLCSEG